MSTLLNESLAEYYIRPAKMGTGFDVMGVGTYGSSSVLAGQAKIVFMDNFETVKECELEYPDCKGSFHNEFTEPKNTFDHLSDESDLQ